MTEKELQINIPSDLLIALNKSEDELKNDMRIFTAINFYENGKLTLGKAAQFAAMPRWEFENLLADHQIPISNLQIEDIHNDLEKMKAI